MSGVTVGELMDFELKNGVNLPCNVILTTSTYGGIVVLGCHVSLCSTFQTEKLNLKLRDGSTLDSQEYPFLCEPTFQ